MPPLTDVLAVTLNWHYVDVEDGKDPRWKYDLALYAYLSPVKEEILYIGKCDRTSVRGRWCYSAKPEVWDCINRRCKSHSLIVAEIEVDHRLTRELLADIESLLIYRIKPCCNWQNTVSRGKYKRLNMRVECRGQWPLSKRVFWDERESAASAHA
jgi:hypothetical protein